jgi:hypothetical protein
MKKRYNYTIIAGFVLTVLSGGMLGSCKEKELEDFEPKRLFTPVNVSAVSGETQATLRWNPSLFSQGKDVTYTVEVARTLEFADIVHSMTTQTPEAVITEESLELKTIYYARVRANAAGNSAASNWMASPSFSISGEQIIAPITSADIKDKSVIVRWRQTAGLTRIVLTPTVGNPLEFAITADDVAASQKQLTGLTPSTLYKVEIFAGNRSKGLAQFTTKELSLYTTTISPADNLRQVIEEAQNGDLIGLEPGVYDYSDANLVIVQKHVTLQSVSGNPDNTKILFKEVNLKGSGAGVKLSGIHFDGSKGNAAYFLNLTGLNSDSDAADFTNILVENCIVEYTANSFMRANRGGNNAHKIGNIVITNTIAFDNGSTSTFNYMLLDKLEFKKLEITQSTFFTSGRAFISWATNIPMPAKPVIIMDHVTLNGFGYGTRNNILMDANGNQVNFTVQNSIIANAPRLESVGTSLVRASADGSEIVVRNSNLFNLTTGGATPAPLTFPNYVQLMSNQAVDLGWTPTTRTFELPGGSPLRTASTTGGAIGDLRWAR